MALYVRCLPFIIQQVSIFFLSSRFKENNIIDRELYNYNNTLEIIAEHGLNGSYRCRVVNYFGTEFSERAILEIIG